MSVIGRRRFVKGIAAGALFAPHVARAQDWPTRPVRFIVHLAAGGGLDFIARLVGEHLSLRLNVDFLKDLMPVSLLGRQPQVLAVHPSLEVKSVGELAAAAKKLASLGCATSGVGSNQHVLMEWFAKVADIKLEHVPYRGAGQAINDLLAGHVKLAILGPTATLPHANAGTIRLLAQSGEARSPSMPDLPTLQESGYPGVSLESWFAAFAPLGTPPAVIARLNAECDKALADKATRDALFKAATEPVGGDIERLAKLARSDSEKYARIVNAIRGP